MCAPEQLVGCLQLWESPQHGCRGGDEDPIPRFQIRPGFTISFHRRTLEDEEGRSFICILLVDVCLPGQIIHPICSTARHDADGKTSLI